jgi:hypothetical protein
MKKNYEIIKLEDEGEAVSTFDEEKIKAELVIC